MRKGSKRASRGVPTPSAPTATAPNGSVDKSAPKATAADVLLKRDHREVKALFARAKKAAGADEKRRLVREICKALVIHTALEEEIFYPACRAHGGDGSSLHEAQVEHDAAKLLIANLCRLSADDPYYDALVTTLREYVAHHVVEEEQPGGILDKARHGDVDLLELGQQMSGRKTELTACDLEALPAPTPRALQFAYQPQPNQSTKERDIMDRQYRERDEHGRFTGQDDRRRDDDYGMRDDRNGSRQARDDHGRFQSESGGGRYQGESRRDDGERGSNRGAGREDRSQSSSGYGERDDRGRYQSQNRDSRDERSSSGGYRDRDEESRYGTRSSRWDDEQRGDRGDERQGGGGRERDDYGRFQSRGDDRDDNGGSGSRSGIGDRDRGSNDQGRGRGWYGDSEGHAQAAEQGWQHREGRGGRGREDDDRRESRGGGRGDTQDHRGWYGDSRGHSEAARRGWEHRG